MPKASSLYLEFLATQTITKPLKHKALAADKQGAVVNELSICAPRPPSEEWRSGNRSGRQVTDRCHGRVQSTLMTTSKKERSERRVSTCAR